jgi:hypothetical protein
MTFGGKGRGRYQLTLAVVWLAYVIVQCPNCPGATTRLVRCGLTAVAPPVAAAPSPTGDGRRDGRANCHGEPGADDHRHSPGGDCCDSVDSRTSTLTARTIVDPPITSVLPWTHAAMPAPLRWDFPARLASLPPQPHAPPRFLLLQSLLI